MKRYILVLALFITVSCFAESECVEDTKFVMPSAVDMRAPRFTLEAAYDKNIIAASNALEISKTYRDKAENENDGEKRTKLTNCAEKYEGLNKTLLDAAASYKQQIAEITSCNSCGGAGMGGMSAGGGKIGNALGMLAGVGAIAGMGAMIAGISKGDDAITPTTTVASATDTQKPAEKNTDDTIANKNSEADFLIKLLHNNAEEDVKNAKIDKKPEINAAKAEQAVEKTSAITVGKPLLSLVKNAEYVDSENDGLNEGSAMGIKKKKVKKKIVRAKQVITLTAAKAVFPDDIIDLATDPRFIKK